jgi:hypothetical protein
LPLPAIVHHWFPNRAQDFLWTSVHSIRTLSSNAPLHPLNARLGIEFQPKMGTFSSTGRFCP